MAEGTSFEDIQIIRNRTENVLLGSLEDDRPVLVESPPGSGKTTAAFEAALKSDVPITYLTGRIDLYEQASDWANEQENLTSEVIPAPHRDCETFNESGEGDHRQAWRLYNKGMSGRDIHFSSEIYTPCGNDCEYLRKLERIDKEVNEIDFLIGHHNHSKRYQYSKDRIVILDEFNPDPFLTSFPDHTSADGSIADEPGKIISHFLKEVNSLPEDSPLDEFEDITDILERRNDHGDILDAIGWLAELGITWSEVAEYEFFKPTADRYDDTNFSAPLLTYGLFCMEKISPGIEASPGKSDESVNLWSIADLPPGYRCLRDRNTGQMYTLEPPDLRDATQVIALDGTPTLALWNLLFAPSDGFDHVQVIKRQDYQSYLESALNMTVVQIGDGLHHAAGGRISNVDEQRMEAVYRLEKKKFALITSKRAIDIYKTRQWIGKYVKRIETENGDVEPAVRNFARVLSSNEFEKERLGCVFGNPFPGDGVVQLWAGFCGERVEPSGEGIDKTFGEFGDKIFQHFAHKQVVQAILRFGRDETVHKSGGSTVYVSTLALPDWFMVNKFIDVFSGSSKRAIVEELVRAADSSPSRDEAYHTRRTLNKSLLNSGREPSSRHVRKVLRELRDYPFVDVLEGQGPEGANLYRWNNMGEYIDLSSPNHFAIRYDSHQDSQSKV